MARRAVRPGQASPESGWIAASAYEEAGNRTVIAVEGFTVPEDIAEIWMGQDPANAPKASSVGAKLYIAATCGAYPF